MSLLAAASAWWNGHISAAIIQAQLVDPINGAVAALQAATAVSADVTTGVFTAANGSGIVTQRGRIEGGWATVYCNYTIGAGAGTPITPNTAGAFTNVAVLNIASAFQSTSGFTVWALPTAANGRVAAHVVSGGTVVKLCAVAGSANIATGDSFSFAGRYPLT